MEPSTPPTITDEPAPLQPTEPAPPISNGTTTSVPEHGVFTGRLNRMGYFLAHVYYVLAIFVLLGFGLLLTLTSRNNPVVNIIAYLIGAAAVILLIVYYVFGVGFVIRRLHDMDQSGWLAFLLLVPFVGAIMALVLLFIPGTSGPNTYGPGPQKTLGLRDVIGL